MRRLSSVVKLGLVGAVMAIGFSGCGSKIAVKRETAQLNLQYKVKSQSPRVDKKIAIVAPRFSDIKALKTARGMNFNEQFLEYRPRLAKAMSAGFEDLILKKGFTIGGKYKTFDDMTYPERKSTFMALVPIIEINIIKKATKQEQNGLHYSEEGEMQVSGELIIKMIEPLSKQMFITKRIDLSDFNIKKPYIYEVKQIKSVKSSGAGGIMGSLLSGALDSAMAPNSLSDSTDKALTEAINEFYGKAMEKIEKYVSQEEILSLEKDVNSAKQKTGGSW